MRCDPHDSLLGAQVYGRCLYVQGDTLILACPHAAYRTVHGGTCKVGLCALLHQLNMSHDHGRTPQSAHDTTFASRRALGLALASCAASGLTKARNANGGSDQGDHATHTVCVRV